MTDQSVLERLASDLEVSDLLVLERDAQRLRLCGGTGRGSSWAGVVDAPLDDEPAARRAVCDGRVVRIGAATPQRIIGPYWSHVAVLVPVGDSHLVVFGGPDMARASDGALLRVAAEAVGACGNVPAQKLLADELEVVHAVRALMDHDPRSVVDTARHIASISADALACDLGVVLVRADGTARVETGGPAAGPDMRHDEIEAALSALEAQFDGPAHLEQQTNAGSTIAGIELVSRLALTIGPDGALGTLLVGHARGRPRGFTSLCQRIGRSLADAAEILLSQALAREQMADERDRYQREARTDRLTGLGNRAAWDEAILEAGMRGVPSVLLTFDVDGLKRTNDSLGHAFGDRLLCGAAEALLSATREGDLVARVGGDEFAVLLRDGDETVARGVLERVASAALAWSAAHAPADLRLAAGWAVTGPAETLPAAFARADARMLESKRT
jgi:diguanylate cyclase (GGDEF)-like protein